MFVGAILYFGIWTSLPILNVKITTGQAKTSGNWRAWDLHNWAPIFFGDLRGAMTRRNTYFVAGVENSEMYLDVFVWSFGLELFGLLLPKVCKTIHFFTFRWGWVLVVLFSLLVLLGISCQRKLHKWYFCLLLKCVKFNENFLKTLTSICGWGVTPDLSLT